MISSYSDFKPQSKLEGSVALLILGFIGSWRPEVLIQVCGFSSLGKKHDLNLRPELTRERQSMDQARLLVDLCVLRSYQGTSNFSSAQDQPDRREEQCCCAMEMLRTLGSDSPDSGLVSGFHTYWLLKPQVGLRIE